VSARRQSRKSSRAAFGSIRRLPSGRYQARYSTDDESRHTAPETFTARKDAEDWLATTRADMVRGTWRAPELGRVTLADFARDHLATRLDLAPKTRQLYADLLAGWIAHDLTMPPMQGRTVRTINLGEHELGSLALAHVRDWHAAALHTAAENAMARAERSHGAQVRALALHHARAWALANGVPCSQTGRLPRSVERAWRAAGEPAAPLPPDLANPKPAPANAGRAVVAQAYRLVRTLLAVAVREGRMTANPCDIPGAGIIRVPKRAIASPTEVAELARAMPPRYAAAVSLAAWSGLRAGEVFGLARRHLDLDAGTVTVDRAAVTSLRDVAPYLGDTKTANSMRTVHLPPHVVSILRDHLDAYTGPSADALIFTEPSGKIVTRETRQRHYDKARRSIGRADLRWHDLRHTGATLAAQAGASLAELQHRLGHSTVRAAMVYQQHSTDRDRDLAQRLSTLAAANGITVPEPRPVTVPRLTALSGPSTVPDAAETPDPWRLLVSGYGEHLRDLGSTPQSRSARLAHVRRLIREATTSNPGLTPDWLTTAHLLDYLNQPEWGHHARKAQRASVAMFCAWAHESGHLDTNPAESLPSTTALTSRTAEPKPTTRTA
jgi:integrase